MKKLRSKNSLKIKFFIKTFFFLIPSILLCACNESQAVKTQNIDPQKYLGSWHEIARFDHWFERNLEKTKANYSIIEEECFFFDKNENQLKIKIVNSGVNKHTKKPSCSTGKAVIKDIKNDSGKLRVSFFPFIWSDYFILFVDENYENSIVGSSTDDYLWILSRKNKLSDEKLSFLLEKCQQFGYDTSKLIFPKQ